MEHIISILVENKFGVLARVAGLFSARGYNIESLSVAPTLDPTTSMITIVTIGDDWKDRYLEGLEWMKEHGEVVYLPYTAGVSTTSIKRKIIENIYSVIAADLRREMEKPEEWKQKQLEARKLKR